jgi:hypothetical protein
VHQVYETDAVWAHDQYEDDSSDDELGGEKPLVVAETAIDDASSPRPSTQWEEGLAATPAPFEEPEAPHLLTAAEAAGEF